MKNRRNRMGTISLLIAAGGFCAVNFLPFLNLGQVMLAGGYSLRHLLSAFFDASLVGALADWFAVTALFRHPLGLALPHTDIIARNKESVARSVPRFLGSFVTQERITAELRQVDYTRYLDQVLADQGLMDEFHSWLRSWLTKRQEAGENQDPGELVRQICTLAAGGFDSATAMAGLLKWARKEGFDLRIIEGMAQLLRTEVIRNREPLVAFLTPFIKDRVGWQGVFISRKTVDRSISGIIEELEALGKDPEHELKLFLAGSIDTWTARLLEADSPDRIRLAGMVKDALLDPGFQNRCIAIADEILAELGESLGRQDSGPARTLAAIESRLSREAASNPVFRQRLNHEAAELLCGLVDRIKPIDALSTWLGAQLEKTDTREFVDRIESAIRNDLEYIRVNGALVGGLVGTVLSVLGAIGESLR